MLKRFKIKKNKNLISKDLIGCMGKLPVQREFIKYNVSRNQIANLDNWLQTAYHNLHRNSDPKSMQVSFAETPLHHFILCSSYNFFPIIGSFIAGKDQSGRNYPFLIFRMIEDPVATEFQSTIPLIYHDFYQQAFKLTQKNWNVLKFQDLQAEVDDLRLYSLPRPRREILELVIEKVSNITLQQLMIAMQLDKSSMQNLLQTCITNFNKLSHYFTHLPPKGIRIPLPKQQDLKPFVVFWLQLFAALVNIKDKRIQIFWNHEGRLHQPALTIYLRPLPETYLNHFINTQVDHKALFDVAREINKVNLIDPRINEITKDTNINLMKLMQHLGELRDI